MATIRAITLSLGEPHPLRRRDAGARRGVPAAAQARAEAEGHTVQTTRVATRPVLQDLGTLVRRRAASPTRAT